MTKWEQLAALLAGGNKPNPLLGMMAAQNPLYTADPTQTVDAARAFSQGMSSAAIGSIPGSGVVNAAGIQPRYDENWFIPAGITQGPNIRENLQSGNYLDAGLQGLGILGDAASVGAMASMVPKSAQRGAINLADDLPMDYDNRMARANDLGFDINKTHYHLTAKDIKEFELGADPSSHTGGGAIWLRDDPKSMRSAHQTGTFYSLKEGSNEIPVFIKNENELPADVLSELRMSGKISDYFPLRVSMEENKLLKDLGYTHYSQSGETVVFDPRNIRSKFAKFDPAKLNSKDLLAGTLPLGFSGMFGADYLMNGEK